MEEELCGENILTNAIGLSSKKIIGCIKQNAREKKICIHEIRRDS